MLQASAVPLRYHNIIGDQKEVAFKEYRGMGSIASMQKGLSVSSEDEFHGKTYSGKDTLIAEGVEGIIPCSGSVADFVTQFSGGILAGLYYIGATSIPEAAQKAQVISITQASLIESHPHDLHITNSGGNIS